MKTPVWFTRDLTLGDEGQDVLIVQRKLDAPLTGTYDEPTAARVRGLQKKMGKKEDGVVDAEVAEVLGEKADAGQTPEWFGQPEQDGVVREILRLSNLESLADALRRFQSALGLEVHGELDEKTAIAVSDRSA